MTLTRMIETTVAGNLQFVSCIFIPVPAHEDARSLAHKFALTDITAIGLGGDAYDASRLLTIAAGLFINDPEPTGDPILSGYDRRAVESFPPLDLVLERGSRVIEDPYIGRIFTDDLVIVEKSPPQLASIYSIFCSGSGAVIGAYTGWESGIGKPMLLLVTVPFGILICSSAIGLGRALEDGLRTRLYRWITERDQPKSSGSEEDALLPRF